MKNISAFQKIKTEAQILENPAPEWFSSTSFFFIRAQFQKIN